MNIIVIIAWFLFGFLCGGITMSMVYLTILEKCDKDKENKDGI